MDASIQKIKQALPFQYAKLIAQRIGGTITQEQVRHVFVGRINDPKILLPVIQAANDLIEEKKQVVELTNKVAAAI